MLRDEPRAAIYCRISDDKAGAGLGVSRQREDCVALAERLGWTVTDVYTDNDISAYGGKRRPEYERMLGAAARHEVEHAIERAQRTRRQMAEAGVFRGGARPFGYEADGMTVREDEAAELRDAAGRVLAGEPVESLDGPQIGAQRHGVTREVAVMGRAGRASPQRKHLPSSMRSTTDET